MAMSNARATPELATDFEQWFARKAKEALVINSPKVLEVIGTWDKVHQTEPSHDATDGPKTLTKFTFFPKLPAELRIKIWKHAHSGPRILRLEYENKILHTVCRQPPPAIVHACRESRSESLRVFKPFFDPLFNPRGSRSNGTMPIVLFDGEVDTLYFPDVDWGWARIRYFLLDVELEDLDHGDSWNSVKRLAFNHETMIAFFSMIRSDPSLLFQFPNLETITLVIDPKVCRDSCGLAFFDIGEKATSPLVQDSALRGWENYLRKLKTYWASWGVFRVGYELSRLREQFHFYMGWEWHWEEKYKELKKPEIQLRMLMQNGPWYSGCIHNISAPEPMELIW